MSLDSVIGYWVFPLNLEWILDFLASSGFVGRGALHLQAILVLQGCPLLERQFLCSLEHFDRFSPLTCTKQYGTHLEGLLGEDLAIYVGLLDYPSISLPILLC